MAGREYNLRLLNVTVAENDQLPPASPHGGGVELGAPDLGVFVRPDAAVIALYAALLAASLLANSLLIFIVVKFHHMHNVTNMFLVNLSVADLLVTLFCMPVQIAKAVTVLWYFGDVMCKTVNFLQGVAVACSVLTLAAMSVDRYLAITQSLRAPWLPSRRGALALLLAIWAAAFAIFAPLTVVAEVHTENIPIIDTMPNGTQQWSEKEVCFCAENWSDSRIKQSFGIFSFVLVYAVPGCVVVVSYSLMGRRLCSEQPPFDVAAAESSVNTQQRVRLVRERRRVAWVLLLLAVLFAVCWLPYNLLQLLVDLGAVGLHSGYTAVALRYTLLLGHANSAINPIVYCLMTRNFQRSLRKLFCSGSGHVTSTANLQLRSLRIKQPSSMRTHSTLAVKAAPALRPASAPPALRRPQQHEDRWRGSSVMQPRFI